MSEEGPPKKADVISIDTIREKKEHDEIRRQLEAALGMKLSISELEKRLTLTEGIDLAKEFLTEIGKEDLNKGLVDAQRKNFDEASTSNILHILNLALMSRGRFKREVIAAAAESLLARFPDEPEPPRAA